jgi:CubicO group peptidase (beta-lactamase class C family)
MALCRLWCPRPNGFSATARVTGRVPAAVAAVVRDGGHIGLESYGNVAGADVRYRIGSITKTFVTRRG